MPELPEVETVRRGLEARVLGRTITRVTVAHSGVIIGDPDAFERQVRGVIRRLERKGKAIAIELGPATAARLAASGRATGQPLSGPGSKPARKAKPGPEPTYYILLRLGMTGQVTVVPRRMPLDDHTHVRIGLDDGHEIRYRDPRRFGKLRHCTREEIDAIFGTMGPDAPAITPDEFVAALRHRRTPIKSWLLNQSRLAGVGNIYADESLFEARIHPLREAGRLTRATALSLHQAVDRVLRQAIDKQGTSMRDYIDVEGNQGSYGQSLNVYGREGEPCPRCGAKIKRLTLSNRSSHYCPRCQPAPRRAKARSLGAGH